MPKFYLLSLNPTSLGVYRNLKGVTGEVHLFHSGDSSLIKFLGREVIVHPVNIESNPVCVVEVMRQMQKDSSSPGMVFVTSDQDVQFLSDHRLALRGLAIDSLPPDDVLYKLNDKHELARMAVAKGINSPRTVMLCNDDVDKADAEIGYPCLLKPALSHEWKSPCASRALKNRKAFVAESRESLRGLLEPLGSHTTRLVAQEIIETSGKSNYSYCCYCDDGRVLWGFVTQKILQFPEKFGTAILCATTHSEEIEAFGSQVVEAFGVKGVCEIEIVEEHSSRELKLIEINTRHWLQHRLATRLGVNISLLDYYHLTGNDAQVASILDEGDLQKRIIWVDDIGYLMHLVKSFFRGGRLFLSMLRGRQIECALFERKKLFAFLEMAGKKVLMT